jgi:hypothetical protein
MLRTFTRAAVAGVAGTLAMDALWYRRYRQGDGRDPFLAWEVTRQVDTWEHAPAPAQMARKLIETATGNAVPVERAAALNNVMHWAYGVTWTVGYGLRRDRPLWAGPVFGALVWASDYVTLPLAGVYEPIWRYDLHTLEQDLSAHLVFGAAADLALRLLGRG